MYMSPLGKDFSNTHMNMYTYEREREGKKREGRRKKRERKAVECAGLTAPGIFSEAMI